MTFTIIGTGNMAWLLAQRLAAAGHICHGIYGRNKNAAQDLAKKIEAPVITALTNINDDADCCIIAVSDNAIAPVAQQLNFTNTVLIHTAGAVYAGILAGSAKDYGVLWPVYSILKAALPAHRNVPVICEASTAKAKSIVSMVAAGFSDNISFMDSKQRAWLHLTAVLSNNFVNHLFALCEKICTEKNIPFSLLQPIIVQTVERLATGSPYQLQTGPAKRGDKSIIEKHIAMLADSPAVEELYKAISDSIITMYSK